jgi:GntR family transcriptional regulator
MILYAIKIVKSGSGNPFDASVRLRQAGAESRTRRSQSLVRTRRIGGRHLSLRFNATPVHCTCTMYRGVMVLHVDPEATTPVYRQIVDGLRVALVNGELAPGDPLPSVRRLALDIGVHFNTVAQAYRELAREGWLQISGRGGAQVRERAVPPGSKPEAATYRRRIEELIAQIQASGATPAALARELRRIAKALEGS